MTDTLNTKPKRRKTSRACNHCHKSHMTCDANRPCNRCVQRGLQDSCQDAPRKLKKYLADVPMNAMGTSSQFRPSESPPPPTNSTSSFQPQHQDPSGPYGRIQSNSPPASAVAASPVSLPPLSQTHSRSDTNPPPQHPELFNQQSVPQHIWPNSKQPLFDLTDQSKDISLNSNDLMKKRSKFLSSAADLEYSTLSNIISDNIFNASTSNEHTPNSINLSPALSPMNQHSIGNNHNNQQSLQEQSLNNQAASPNTAINDAFILNNPSTANTTTPTPYSTTTNNNNSMRNPMALNNKLISQSIYDNRTLKCDESINQYYLGTDNDDYSKIVSLPDVTEQIEMLKDTDPSAYYERNSRLAVSVTIGILPDDSPFTRISDPVNDIKHYFKEPEEIYEKVNRPYSYTPGYHSLIAYLRKRFNKEMLVKMAETMASYRPSFIACTNSLKEHDLIFMEQCFQRTLLTYDSIIRVSGTPTIVWRRTGEIAYVGNEFCTLTGWSKEELLNANKKLIVELLDDKSVLEYFQLFLKIAFGDFFGATMTECTLLAKKHNTKIKTRCSWTLKRDVFGIPMMIIGNFLPIL